MALVSSERADQFFMRLLDEALRAQKVAVSAKVHVYLAGLLVRYITADHDLCAPLTDRYLHAREQNVDRIERFTLLRSVGDDALMLSGVFWRRIEQVYHRPLDSAYHRSIGPLAYRQLSGDSYEHPYAEMAEKFSNLADALMRLDDACSVRSDEDIMRLLHLWQTTRSRAAAQALARYGIAPVKQSDTPS